MVALVEDIPLLLFIATIAVGGLIASPMGISRFPEMGRTRRLLLGLLVIEAAGFAASVYTWMIHNQIAETGASGLCAAEGLVQCGSVIGDPNYSTFLGLPWGIIGIAAFATLGWFTIAIYMDMKSDWAQKYVDYAWYVSLPGIVGIIWLIIVEVALVEGAPHICPYCTSVHIALAATIYLLYLIRNDRDEGNWEITRKKSKEELLAIARKARK
ncbi:MAG TPA: vitamin K epoxide reductase family protein [Candidatus Poseidoniales archaeon]|nr:vitamin K epoxide reductase family protein [Candidatus Poseidoniales archaeon]